MTVKLSLLLLQNQTDLGEEVTAAIARLNLLRRDAGFILTKE